MTRLLHYSYENLATATDNVGGDVNSLVNSLGVDSLGIAAGGTVAIGNFDGLHRGHIALLASLRAPSSLGFMASSLSKPLPKPLSKPLPKPLSKPLPKPLSKPLSKPLPKPWILLTFEPHPRCFFSSRLAAAGSAEALRLSSAEQKQRWLEDSELGIDSIVVMRFDERLSQMSAQDFVQRFLLTTLRAKHLVVGADFAFGYRREGTLSTLREMSCSLSNELGEQNSFSVHEFPTLRMDCLQAGSSNSSSNDFLGSAYSSSRARAFLRAGDLRSAREILGRDFEIEGVVEKGKGLGSKLGFPTANIDPRDYCRPLFGVYCVRVVHNDNSYEAVASFGQRPTLGSGLRPLLEVHFFSNLGDLCGSTLRVSFEKFQRKEEHYASLEALQQQIGEDVVQAKSYFVGCSARAGAARGKDIELSA